VERLGAAPNHFLGSNTQLPPVSHGCWDSAVVRLRPLQLLRGLSLRNCGLRELMPPRGMQLLQYLDLSGNRLQALQVTVMERVFLSHKQGVLGAGKCVVVTPPRGMQLLQCLDLSGNRLQALQVGVGG
jgi:hypothetical protein